MSFVKIKSITVKGDNRESSIVFGDRLNIISGPSNTGKTYIYECIDYLFGKETSKIKSLKKYNYHTVIGEFYFSGGTVTISRLIETYEVKIKSNNNIIESGEYTTKVASLEAISNTFLKMLEIDDFIKIPSNQKGKSVRLTWRIFKQHFMIKELTAEQEQTILLPSQNTQKTTQLSSLLYLLYKTDFSPYILLESSEKRAVRKKMQTYITKKLDENNMVSEALTKKIKEFKKDFPDPKIELSNLESQLFSLENKIAVIIDKKDKIVTMILSEQENLNKFNVTLSKFRSLTTQYESDIKRLNFILDGEDHVHDLDVNTKCPYCESEMEEIKDSPYKDAAYGELMKIVADLGELEESITSIESKIESIESNIAELEKQKLEQTNHLEKTLKPEYKKISGGLANYREIIELEKESDVLKKFADDFGSDLKELSDDKFGEKLEDYKPRELFSADFKNQIANNYINILEKISFHKIGFCEFDMRQFDIVIDDADRSEFGKGFRAILNTTLLLALRKYINENAEINPHFYIIDSPLHGLNLPDSTPMEKNFRVGFFKYLYENYGNDQIIIFENTSRDEVQSTNDENINIIHFTKDQASGRYGFIEGLFD